MKICTARKSLKTTTSFHTLPRTWHSGVSLFWWLCIQWIQDDPGTTVLVKKYSRCSEKIDASNVKIHGTPNIWDLQNVQIKLKHHHPYLSPESSTKFFLRSLGCTAARTMTEALGSVSSNKKNKMFCGTAGGTKNFSLSHGEKWQKISRSLLCLIHLRPKSVSMSAEGNTALVRRVVAPRLHVLQSPTHLFFFCGHCCSWSI